MSAVLFDRVGLVFFAILSSMYVSGANAEERTHDALDDPPLFGYCLSDKDLCALQCKDGGSTKGPGPCLATQNAIAEQALNETYQRLLDLSRNFDSSLPPKLVRSQRAWLSFRKYNCEYHESKTLTNDRFDFNDCMLRITRQRALEPRQLVRELKR